MSEFKFIQKDTDLSKVLHPVSWDTVVNGEPYQVFNVYESTKDGDIEYIHTSGGHWGENSYWCCPRDEEPSYDNLVPFDGQSVCWGLNINSKNYFHEHMGDMEIGHRYFIEILRNGEVFNDFPCNDVFWGISKAKTLISEYDEHPLELLTQNFEEKCIGRKIRYKGLPAVIKRYVHGQAAIMIEPEEGVNPKEFFSNPHNIEDEHMEDFYEEWASTGQIKADITSPLIWWWRH